MQYSKAKNINLSKFTLGTVQLGMNYGIANKSGKPDMNRSFNILETAIEEGINSFDTSLHYGDSERVLGKYFQTEKYEKRNCRSPLITTKFKLEADKNATPCEIEKKIRERIESSLGNLGINKIPIYLAHDPKEMLMHKGVLADILKKLKNEGLIEKAGVSVYNCEEADEMLKYDVYEAIQLPMNILDTRFVKSGILAKLHKAGIIVFIRSIFLQGLFFLDPENLTGNLTQAGKYLNQLNELAQGEGMSVAQLALSYIRDMEEVTSLVIGAEAPQQVKENVKLFEGPGITENTRQNILDIFEVVPMHILVPSMWSVR